MKRIIDRIFRNADEVICIHGEERLVGKGVITAMSKIDEGCSVRSDIGNYAKALHLFMGNIEGMEKGDILTYGTREFRVINSQLVEAFGKLFCVRAVLEERGV